MAPDNLAEQYCRITIVSGAHRLDMAAPLDTPWSEQLNEIIRTMRQSHPGWAIKELDAALYDHTGRPLDPAATPAKSGVHHGDVLHLATPETAAILATPPPAGKTSAEEGDAPRGKITRTSKKRRTIVLAGISALAVVIGWTSYAVLGTADSSQPKLVAQTRQSAPASPTKPTYTPSTPMTRLPAPITSLTATASGVADQATIVFNAPPSNGATSIVTCTVGTATCGTWTFAPAGQIGVVETIDGLPDGHAALIDLRDCIAVNPSPAQCDTPASISVTPFGPLQNLQIATRASGPAVDYTISVDPQGAPATVSVQTSMRTTTLTTGAGPWSWSGTDQIGYSQTDHITVTVSSSGRTSLNSSANRTTGAPPTPTVTVSRGALCGGEPNEPICDNILPTECGVPSCGYVHVQTANFTTPVTCVFSDDMAQSLGSHVYGPDQSADSTTFFGIPGETVIVTCDGVAGSYVWPSS
jgi:WXG100 protein secretion system (Wss), protein YukD